MKKMKTLTIVLLVMVLMGTSALAGDAGKGKALFADPKLGTTGKSCSTCHSDGSNLLKAASRDEAALTEVINSCMVTAMKGSPLDTGSAEMKDLISYLRLLPSEKAPAKKKRVIIGC